MRLTHGQIKEIQQLAKARVSLEQIATKLNIAKTTVYYHAKYHCRKMTRMNVDALTETEQGYLVGMFVGDGYINTWVDKNQNRQRFIVKIALDAQRDQDVADYVQFLFSKAGKRTTRFIEETTLIIKASSKEFAKYLLKYVKVIKQEKDHPLNKILLNEENWSQDFKFGFISGIIDSDGYVFYDGQSKKQYIAEVKTSNPTLKEQLFRILATLRMNATEFIAKSYKGAYSTRPCYRIHILKKGIQQNRHRLNSVKLNRYPSKTPKF